MPLEDWLIIVGGETLREEYIPLDRAVHSGSTAAAEFLPLEPAQLTQAEAAQQPLPPSPQAEQPQPPQPSSRRGSIAAEAPIGTKFRWTAAVFPTWNYRVAIQTKNGLLQVKAISAPPNEAHEFEVDTTRKMFDTYEAWIVSLPHGMVMKTLPEDMLSALERRKQHSLEVLEQPTAAVIEHLQRKWNVHTGVHYSSSRNQQIQTYRYRIAQLYAELGKITPAWDLQTPCYRGAVTRDLQRTIHRMKRLEELNKEQPEAADYQYSYLWQHSGSKGRMEVLTPNGWQKMCYDHEAKKIAVQGTPEQCSHLERYTSLTEIPGMTGRPKIKILYRRKEIEL
jgi:hypothetical protein